MLDLETFKKNYLVVGLNDAQVAEIASLAVLRRLAAQETLIRAGDPGGDFFVILNGRLNVLTPDGDKLSEVGPGSVLGEISLVDAGPRTATVIAIGLVDVAVIPTPDLRRFLSQNRDLGFTVLANLSRVLAGRLRLANEKIDELYDKTTDSWDRAL